MGKSPEGFEESGPSRFGAKSAQWVRVNEADALGELLQRADFVIPGIPVLFAVAKGTEFRERFLANEVKMWKS